jgi:hypothetical protein
VVTVLVVLLVVLVVEVVLLRQTVPLGVLEHLGKAMLVVINQAV